MFIDDLLPHATRYSHFISPYTRNGFATPVSDGFRHFFRRERWKRVAARSRSRENPGRNENLNNEEDTTTYSGVHPRVWCHAIKSDWLLASLLAMHTADRQIVESGMGNRLLLGVKSTRTSRGDDSWRFSISRHVSQEYVCFAFSWRFILHIYTNSKY